MITKQLSFPSMLAILIAGLIAWSGINPYDRIVWIAEIFPVIIVLVVFVWTQRQFRFSNLAYGFASIWLIMHTIGAHYTFERVPFDWFTNLFDFERNHYDRIAHFAIGFYAYPIAEFISRKKLIENRRMIFLFALFAIMSLAGAYEVIEWWFAVGAGGDQASDFLGSQGDIWDAQKDILADTFGALFSLVVFWKIQNIGSAKD